MRERITKKLTRLATVAGVALVVLGAYGALGGARASHSSCGTYCWNVYAPYPGPESVAWSESGSGYQWNYGPYASLSNGEFIDSQQVSSSNSWGDLYTTPWMEGDPINFHTEVGVTYTFSVLVEAWYVLNGWCDPPFGSWGDQATVTVVASITGPSGGYYSVSDQPLNAQTAGDCDILAPHGSGNLSVSGSPDITGGWGGFVTLTISEWIPAGIWTPEVAVTVYTYSDAQLLAGASASLNMGTGGYYAQWTNLNINWGPGEG